LRRDLGDKVTRHITKEELWFIHPPLALTGKLLKKIIRWLACYLRQSSDGLFWVRAILRDEINVEGGAISHKHFAISIKDQSAWWWDIHHSKTIVLGAVAKNVPINDLEMPQPKSQHKKTGRAESHSDPRPHVDV
jgi:hypothetical protein